MGSPMTPMTPKALVEPASVPRRQFWQLLHKPSAVWRSIDLAQFELSALRGPPSIEGVRCATELAAWIRARAAGVEALSISHVEVVGARILLLGLLESGLPALISFTLDGSEWADLPASDFSWLCAKLGGCLSLQSLELHMPHLTPGPERRGEWAQLSQLTRLDLQNGFASGVGEFEWTSVPPCALQLPRLRSLSLGLYSGLRFTDWASCNELQSVELNCCEPADLQALASLNRLHIVTGDLGHLTGRELQQLPASGMRELFLYCKYAPIDDGMLRDAFHAGVQTRLQVLDIAEVWAFPMTVTTLTDLRSLRLACSGDLVLPAGLRACKKLEALALEFFTVMNAQSEEEYFCCSVEEVGLGCFPLLQTLTFERCRLRCDRALVDAALLPALRTTKFDRVLPADEPSREAMFELVLTLQRLGREKVLHGVPKFLFKEALQEGR